MKKKIAICLLSVLLAAVSVCGCTDKDDKTKTENSNTENNSSLEDIIKENDGKVPGDTIIPGTDKTLDQIIAEAQQSELVIPQGEITEIWFEETFKAYYPKQLKDIVFTKMYLYGDLESNQPVICLCSEKLSEIEVFAVANGKAGDVLYTVEELLPMEAIVLQVELSEQPDIGMKFKDEQGKVSSYALSRTADSSEVVMTEISAE
ncbi:MAG: hypothetical protein IKV97_00785 [Clostridia bacterium]|nr:hypothetical protein [Clostridia bacterium]